LLKCNLRVLMAKQKIDTIQELMKKSGLSRNAINNIYREEKLEGTKLETFIKLCDVFDCQLSDIIEYVPDEN